EGGAGIRTAGDDDTEGIETIWAAAGRRGGIAAVAGQTRPGGSDALAPPFRCSVGAIPRRPERRTVLTVDRRHGGRLAVGATHVYVIRCCHVRLPSPPEAEPPEGLRWRHWL